MRGWALSYSRHDGWRVVLYDDIPRWIEITEEVWDFLCTVTRGWIGGHGMPEVMWKIPVWIPKRYPDGMLRNSVAGKLFDFETWLLCKVVDHREYEKYSIPVSKELAQEMDSEFFDIFEGDDESG